LLNQEGWVYQVVAHNPPSDPSPAPDSTSGAANAVAEAAAVDAMLDAALAYVQEHADSVWGGEMLLY